MNIHPSNELDQLKAKLPLLAAEARDRAGEFEQSRQIALDYVDKLKAAGVYRVLVAESQGGLGGSLLDWFEMAVTLAESDASTGWTCAHGAVCSALIANTADPRFVETFFADPNNTAAWSNQPRVEVKEVEGGLQINGRWGFGTGCTAAAYVGGVLTLPSGEEGDPSRLVVALAPFKEAKVDDTWDPIGLAGTGSHDIVFEDIFVPWERIFTWPGGKPKFSFPTSVFVPSIPLIASCAAVTHLGLARHAIDEARRELDGKNDRYTGQPMLSKPVVVNALEEAEGLHHACVAGMEKALNELWQSGLRGEMPDQALRIRMRLAAVTAVHQCESIVRSVYDIVGASALRRGGVLQRLYRDASCLTHHGSVNRNSFEKIGRVRGGFEPIDHTI